VAGADLDHEEAVQPPEGHRAVDVEEVGSEHRRGLRVQELDLLAKLRGLGVDADREKLAKLCEGALSAEEVVSERLRLHGWDADWAWICLVTLWERWWQDKVCLELLDDKVQAGYEADQRNDFVASGRIWLDAWSDMLRLCDAVGARSIGEFDDHFPMTQSLFNWCQDLEMALQNGGEHDPELRTARLEMAAEWLRRFPREDGLTTGNFRRALAGSNFETGQQETADGSPHSASLPAIVRIVNCRGLSPPQDSSSQRSGVATGAPRRATPHRGRSPSGRRPHAALRWARWNSSTLTMPGWDSVCE